VSTPPVDVSDLFFVRYQPQRMLVLAMELSAEVEFAHRRLCDYLWARGAVPACSGKRLAELLRTQPHRLPAVLRGLRAIGWRMRHGRLSHPEASAVLREAVRAHQSASDRGRGAAEARWNKADPACTSIADASPDACPRIADADAAAMPKQCHKDKDKDKVKKENSTVPERLTAERSALSAQEASPEREGEAGFLKDVADLWPEGSRAGKLELTNWGGWWRNRFRENPRKARAVLAEIRSLRKEGRPVKNPGAAAADLWKRLP
jgi:hypothetical protein